MSRLRLALLGTTLGACACVADAPPEPTPAHSPGGPPFVAWLEAFPHSTTVVVVPTRVLAGAIEIDTGRSVTQLSPRGGRLDLAPGAARVTASWRDPSGVAAAHVELEHPPRALPPPPRFEAIAPYRVAPSVPPIEQAIRIR